MDQDSLPDPTPIPSDGVPREAPGRIDYALVWVLAGAIAVSLGAAIVTVLDAVLW